MRLPVLCNAALSVFCFTAEDVNQFAAEKTTAFLDAFSLIPGKANSNLQLPGQYNELQSHPFIRLPDGHYFLPIGFNLSEAIYEGPFYWMNKDKPYSAEALRHRGDFAQSVTAELLRGVFGESKVYTGVQIEKNKGHTLTDIDVLAIAWNKAVIAQVKSKRLTELAKPGDESKLVADFEAAVQDAYNQALLSRQAILDRTNKLLANGRELLLPEAIDEAYILCITLDHYPAVTHQADVYLKKGSGDPFPLALSVFDLDVFAFYFKDPFEFLYYLRQRVALNDHFKANSELSLLGFHLKHKLFKEENVSMVALDDSFAQLIDANFPALRGSVPKTTAADKLYPKWKNEEFQQLVDQIKSTGISGFTDAIFFLYDLAGKGADQLVTFLKSIKLKAALDGRSHDARLLYSELNAGITIVSEPRSPEALQTKLLPLAEMSKYRSKADVWLALGCMATSPRLVDAMGFTKEPWKEDLSLRDLIAKLPFGGTAINHSGTKIGRNDQCPCGSGQKFKRCHGK